MVMNIVMRHFFCFVESYGKDTATISDADFFEFMKFVSEFNKGSIGMPPFPDILNPDSDTDFSL